jgi:hypothetical protein
MIEKKSSRTRLKTTQLDKGGVDDTTMEMRKEEADIDEDDFSYGDGVGVKDEESGHEDNDDEDGNRDE